MTFNNDININIDIVLLLIIFFIIGALVGMYFKQNKAEHIVNLDDSRKIELSKCCTDAKCYSKPPHLRDNCIVNKENAKKELDKEFQQMYTQEEYYTKLNELNIINDLNNKQIDEKYLAKMNEQLVINPALDKTTDENIRKDDRDEVRGYDMLDLAPYIK
jgi:hypothetical protein